MKTFSVGIVGAGLIARGSHLPILLSMQNVRMAWITDSDPAAAQSVAEAFGVRNVKLSSRLEELPDCDVALLAIPVGVRQPYYQALARRNIAVFAEKPFALSYAEHKSATQLFPPHLVACGYTRRTYESINILKTIVSQHCFGPLVHLRITEGGRATKTGTDQSHYDDYSAAGGGILISLGCHALDAALYITQADDFRVMRREVELDGKIDRKAQATIQLSRTIDSVTETCEFEFCVSWLDRQDNLIELDFARAKVRARIGADAVVEICDIESKQPWATFVASERGARTSGQAFFLEWDHFLRGIEAGQASLVSASSSLLTAALIDDLYGRDWKHK